MARPEKVAEVKAIAERIQGAQSMILADYSGLTVEQMTIFRSNCRASAVECRVVKNRLACIAATASEMTVMNDHLKGPTAIIFGAESQVDPARIVVEFAKENEAMGIKGGFVDGQYLGPDEVVALSKTPSRDELLAMMMGSINSPARGLACTMSAVIAGLARTIKAVAEKQAGEAA